MKKVIFSLLVLAVVAALLWVNYSGFFLLQGTWVCQSVEASVLPAGMGGAAISAAATLGATVSLHFTLGKMTLTASAFGAESSSEFDYLAQTGRLIFGDVALHYALSGDTLTLSNTVGAKMVLTKQN